MASLLNRLSRTAATLACLVLAACGTPEERDPAIGEAYAGPATLALRKEIDVKSPTATIVHHGDKLEIISQRRRLYRVRTAKGIEGWTEDNGLLDKGQMDRLRRLAQESAGLPSQGVATTFDIIRVHTEPNRLSASFLQIGAGEKVDVIAHKVAVRAPLPKRQLVLPRPKLERAKKKDKPKGGVPPPPPPEPPQPPKDWVALSKKLAMTPDEDQPPAAHDDWTLIRTKEGRSGWVLSSRLYMAVPDEVAQYAEGHRITSYFSIGKIRDSERDVEKDIWLWTTAASLGEDHDFDGYRVFVWSLRHHRYETAFIQRRERGFFPVIAKRGEFSVCLEDDDGHRVRHEFRMDGNAVRSAGQSACPTPTADDSDIGIPAHIEIHAPAPSNKSLYQRARDRLKTLFGKRS